MMRRSTPRFRIEQLRSIPLFSACNDRELATVDGLVDDYAVGAGAVLAQQGTPARQAFVIVSGEARSSSTASEIATLRAGDSFGEMALLSRPVGLRSATVTATTDMQLLVLEPRCFQHADGGAVRGQEAPRRALGPAALHRRAGRAAVGTVAPRVFRKPGFRATLERLASFPDGRPTLHLLQGLAFLRDQEFEKAVEELQSAAKLNPDLPRVHFSLGLAHFKLGQNKEAIAALENAANRGSQDFPTFYYLAEALADDGSLDAARQRLDAAIKLDPNSPEANGLLGKILFKQGRAVEAVKPLELAVARLPGDQERRYLLARVYQQLGRREDAAREFAEVQKLKAKQLEEDRKKISKP